MSAESRFISAAAERERLKPVAQERRPRGRTKPCPIGGGCPEIRFTDLMCRYHEALIPSHLRGFSWTDTSPRALVGRVMALSSCWSVLESAAVPLPWESELRGVESWAERKRIVERAGHRDDVCVCDWCGPLLDSALQLSGIGRETFWKAVAQLGLGARREPGIG